MTTTKEREVIGVAKCLLVIVILVGMVGTGFVPTPITPVSAQELKIDHVWRKVGGDPACTDPIRSPGDVVRWVKTGKATDHLRRLGFDPKQIRELIVNQGDLATVLLAPGDEKSGNRVSWDAGETWTDGILLGGMSFGSRIWLGNVLYKPDPPQQDKVLRGWYPTKLRGQRAPVFWEDCCNASRMIPPREAMPAPAEKPQPSTAWVNVTKRWFQNGHYVTGMRATFRASGAGLDLSQMTDSGFTRFVIPLKADERKFVQVCEINVPEGWEVRPKPCLEAQLSELEVVSLDFDNVRMTAPAAQPPLPPAAVAPPTEKKECICFWTYDEPWRRIGEVRITVDDLPEIRTTTNRAVWVKACVGPDQKVTVKITAPAGRVPAAAATYVKVDGRWTRQTVLTAPSGIPAGGTWTFELVLNQPTTVHVMFLAPGDTRRIEFPSTL